MQEKTTSSEALSLVANQETALAHLRRLATPPGDDAVGPAWVGATTALRDAHAWRRVVGYYAQAFSRQSEIFPYFADRSA